MRVFKKSYRTKKGKQEARKWTIELVDHIDVIRRFQGFVDKSASEALGRQIEKLVRYKQARELPDPETLRWIEDMPPKLRDRLIDIALLEKNKAEVGKPLSEHLEAFRAKLKLGFKPKLKSGCTDNHVRTVSRRVERIVEGCKFLFWTDVNLDIVHEYLTGLDISDKTYNYYIRDFMQFVKWMLKSKRADIAPGGELPRVETEDEDDKRAFTLEEMGLLIEAAKTGPQRQLLKAYHRAVMYLIAAETGFRMKEMRTLKVGSFDLDNGSVSIMRENAKDRRAATIPLKTKRTKQLREYFEGRDPDERAFRMWTFPKGSEMVRADLEAARCKWLKEAENNPPEHKRRQESDFLNYIDDEGLKGCFHSFRKTFITNLDKTDATLSERMTLARHSMKGSLTLDRYTQVRGYNLRRVVEQLPDLPWPGESSESQAMRATGTDGNLGALYGAREGGKPCISTDFGGQLNVANAQLNADKGSILQTHNPLVVGSNPTGPIRNEAVAGR